MINIPSSVGQLSFENVAHTAPLQLRVHVAAPMHEKDIIRAEGAIDDQLAAPMAIRLLLAQQVLLRARDRSRDFFVVRRIKFRYFWSRARQRNEVLAIPACRSDLYDALAAASARFPVRCPLPELTPLKARTSLPRREGFGFEPKLNLIVFHVSPRCACSPNVAVGS